MKIRLAALILALVIGITLIFQVLIPQNNNVYTDGSNNVLSFEDLQSMVGGLEDESQVSVGEDGSIIINGDGTDETDGDVLEETTSVPACDCGNSSNHDLSQHSDLCARKKSVIEFAKLYNPQGLYSIYDTLGSDSKEFLLYYLKTQLNHKYDELQELINPSLPTDNKVYTTVDNKTISIEGNIPKGAVLNTSVTDSKSQEFLIDNIVKQFCTSNSKVYAYDISMSKDGRSYQPDGYFTATIENMVGKIPEGKKARVNIIHFLDTKEAVDSAINSGIALKYTSDKDLSAMFPEETKASNNNKVIYYTKTGTFAERSNEGDSVFTFEVTSFSTYMFTVDFYYGENLYKMPGGESILLSELFEALDIAYDVTNVSSATVDEAAEAFLNISEQADGDFVISSTGVSFTTWHELTVTMNDGEVVYITFTDDSYPTFNANANNLLNVNDQAYPSIVYGTISGDKTWTINYTGGSKGSIALLIDTTAGVIIPSGASLTIKLNDATKNYYAANPDATPIYFRRSGDTTNHKPYFKVNGTGKLTIEGYTYANGTKKALEILGKSTGGIYNTDRFIHDDDAGSKSTITVTDIAVDLFHNSTGGGGVITVANGSLTVNNCIMDDCLSTKSGAGAGAALRVQNSATLTVNNTTITNSYSSTQGGAIYLDATSTATLNNVSISGCSAADKGGAISNNGTVTIKNSSFSNNTVTGTNTDARGGALWIGNNTTTTIEYSSFTNCSAYLGGAIGMYSYTNNAGTNDTAYVINPSTIIGTTFNGNSATENGGACYFDNQKGYLRVVDCDFIGNHAGQSGGAIYQSGTSMDIGNVAILSTDQLTNYGLTVADAATTRSVFTGNYAANGGALYVKANRSCGLKGTQITGNYSTNNPTDTTGGGGVFLDNASIGLTVGHYNDITGNYSGVSDIANLTSGTLCNVLLPGNKTTPDNTRFFAQTNGLRTPATDPLSGSIGVYTTNLGKQFIVTADCTNGGHHAFTYGESRFRADGGDAAVFTCDRNTLGTSRYRYVSEVNDATNGCNDLYFENGTVLDWANFHWEGLSPNPTTIYTTAASNRVVPPTVSRTGYDLEAWVRDDGVSFPASNNYVLVEPIDSSRPSYNDFTPAWTPAKYDVTFNANGGTPTTVVEQTYTAEYILPAQPPTRQGYTFDAWYTEASGGTKITEATTVTTTADHTLYAHWSKNKYTVTFNANGGTPATAETEQTYDSYYAFPTQPTRTGYNFVGWFTEAENGTQVYETTTVKTADEHTLYAHWTKKTMTVTFRSGVDGLNPSPATITVTYGEAYGQLPTLSREYHDFLGWYTDLSAGTKVVETTVVTEENDHNLYARWEKSKCVYVISFDANCGDVDASTMPVSSTQSSQDESYQHTWSETPTRPGHIFMGWATASDGDVVVDKDTFIYNMTCQPDEISSVTLYAVWRWNTATITIKNAAAAGTSVNPGQVFAYNVAFGVNTDNEFGVTIKGLGSVTIYECEIMDLDLAQYINYSVENVNDWSWRYDSNGDASFDFASHNLRDDYGVPNKMPHVVVTFTYAKDNDAWASYHSDIEVLNQ